MLVQSSRQYQDAIQNATIAEMPQSVATVAALKLLTGADNRLRYCVATDTFYRYEATGAAYTADDLYVLTTGDAGNTRWIGVAGQYVYRSTLPSIDKLYDHSTAYSASGLWAAKTVSVAADRYKILSPVSGGIVVGTMKLFWSAQVTLDLSAAGDWDTVAGTDYTVAANRAGKDFYIYACQPASGTTPVFLVSAASTFPDGYDANTSRKVAGFHCLCVAVAHETTLTAWAADTVIALGETRKPTVWLASNKIIRCVERTGTFKTHAVTEPNINGTAVNATVVDNEITWIVEVNALEGYVAGDILPYSVYNNINFRPEAVPEGTVRIPGTNEWMDIYPASGTGAATTSVYNVSASTTRTLVSLMLDLHTVNKYPPSAKLFLLAALGSNNQSAIAGGGVPAGVGGHSDAYGRRMVSSIGVEDLVGVFRLILSDSNSADGTKSILAGGYYGSAAGNYWSNDGPQVTLTYYSANQGVRGVSKTREW